MNELKPCPFCGGKAIYNEKKVRIECIKCEAQIRGVKTWKKVPNYREFLEYLWNRRTIYE